MNPQKVNWQKIEKQNQKKKNCALCGKKIKLPTMSAYDPEEDNYFCARCLGRKHIKAYRKQFQ